MAAGPPQLPMKVDPRRMASIDDDDFAEYDVTEHRELSQGIPERFAQQTGPVYFEPGDEGQDSEEDEVLDFTMEHLGRKEAVAPEGAEGSDEATARLYMQKQIHTKTVIKDGKEETIITEESQIQQDQEPPEELREGLEKIIEQFMETGGEQEAKSPMVKEQTDV